MRLMIYLLLVAIFPTFATGYSQSTVLKFSENPETLGTVIETIENQTDYRIFYKTDQITLETPVNITKSEATVAEVLKTSLAGSNISYSVIGQMIVLAPTKYLNLANKVTGTVTDESGSTMPGVSIQVEGTNIGTTTDLNGKFSIELPKETGVLLITFIGYTSQKIAVTSGAIINVTMILESKAIEGIVVVGYGNIKKSDLTGSVSSIKPTELLHIPTQRVDQALQGRTAGVFIMNTDGSPGGNTIIRIRGLNSISGGSEPLIIIDGLQGGSINSVNPNDIASLEILKDASATAIYGSRGSNGVILITTKLGVKGKPVIEAGFSTGFSQISNKLPAMSAADFAKTANKWRMLQTGAGNVPTPLFTDAEIANWEKNGGTDWQDEVYQTGVLQNANLAVSGATEKLKYMVSIGNVDQKGIVTNTTYKRISLRANLNADVTDWMDFGLNYGYSRESGNGNSFKYSKSGYLGQLGITSQTWAPTVPVYDENGNYSVHPPGYGGAGSGNPVAWALEPITDNPTYSSNANLFLNFKIIEGLTIKVIGGAQFTNDYYREYFNTKTIYGKPVNGSGRILESVFERYQNTNILTYDNTIGVHHLTFTGVVEQINEVGKGSSMSGTNFLVDQLNFDNMSGAKSVTVSSTHNQRSLLSYMGRINYGLNNKYLATFSYRADGSSVFGADNKWGYFPSGSLAWRLSQEDFLKDSPFVSDLKLRGSYGLTGNQGINPYQSFAKLGSSPAWQYNYPWDGQNTTNIGFGISGIANTSLKWETTAQTDLGMDVSFFKGRLTSTIDVYKKVTKDLLMNRSLPGYVGVSSVLDNVGSIENKGIEIMIGGDPLVGKFNWKTSFNVTVNRNKVLDLGPNKRINVHVSQGSIGLYDDFMFLEVGQPFGLMNGWKFMGLWSSDQDAEARSYGQLPGDPHYADIAGVDAQGNVVQGPDGIVDKYDKVTILKAFPKFTYGWTNQFSYKGFELSALIVGSQGNQLLNAERIHRETPMQGNDPLLMDYWTPENQNTIQPAMYDGKYREDQHLVNTYNFGANYGDNSRFVEDASFIRLKSITLAYSFEQKLLKSIGFQMAKVYISGTNLLTITKYSGYDPEVAMYQGSDAGMGVDDGLYPPSKMYSFGINFIF